MPSSEYRPHPCSKANTGCFPSRLLWYITLCACQRHRVKWTALLPHSLISPCKGNISGSCSDKTSEFAPWTLRSCDKHFLCQSSLKMIVILRPVIGQSWAEHTFCGCDQHLFSPVRGKYEALRGKSQTVALESRTPHVTTGMLHLVSTAGIRMEQHRHDSGSDETLGFVWALRRQPGLKISLIFIEMQKKRSLLFSKQIFGSNMFKETKGSSLSPKSIQSEIYSQQL